MVFGDRIPPTKDKERTVPLNDDPDALSDHEYAALLAEAETTAEPCPVAVPADELAAALARLDAEDGQDG
jgi:hypothetical protein